MKRTPRYYDGIYSPSKPINLLLADFMAKIRPDKKREKEKVFKAWYAIIGEKFSSYTKPLYLKEGTLCVQVKSQTLYALLSVHEKERLLRELRQKLGDKIVRNLRFQVG